MGKSEVVKWIIQSFKVGGKTVGVICLCGIACQVYDHGWALTIHSFYGLSMADLPWCQLEDRSAGNSLIQDRIKVLDAVIWDEASKSSRRMFEVIRFLHQKLATNEFHKALPFAGKQVTLVGEFLQFQPVPNLLNEGEFMFYSPLFNLSIPHHFDLTKIMHQLEVSLQLSNRQELDALPGDLVIFQALFGNDWSKSMSWPGTSVQQLKHGCIEWC